MFPSQNTIWRLGDLGFKVTVYRVQDPGVVLVIVTVIVMVNIRNSNSNYSKYSRSVAVHYFLQGVAIAGRLSSVLLYASPCAGPK